MNKQFKIHTYLFYPAIFLLGLILAACSKNDSNPAPPYDPCASNANLSAQIQSPGTYSQAKIITPLLSGIHLSGTIFTAEGTAVDRDVNDPLAAYASNNSVSSAQPILNPASVGGYVNVPYAGASGRSCASGDTDDYYTVDLAPNQSIDLEVSNRRAALRLTLEDMNGNLVQSAVQNGSTHRITVSAAGSYLIHVKANSGASNYVLTLGIKGVSACDAFSGLSIDNEFVPGEIIVRFNDAGLAPTKTGLRARAQSLGLEPKLGAPGRDMLMSLGDDTQTSVAFAALGLSRQATPNPDQDRQRKLDTLAAIEALRARDDVVSARPNYIRKALLAPDDVEYIKQWNLPLINLEAAWDITTGASDVIVAVVDTGVLLNHPDMQGQLVQGYDFIRNAANARDGNSIDNDPDDVGDGDGVSISSSFHGTHVAGIIAAATNNVDTETNTAIGIAGVAWNVKIMPLRALGSNGGTQYDIEQAIRYAAGLENDAEDPAATAARVSNGLVADVINLSLGGPLYDTDDPQLFYNVRDAGVIVVAAAGNDSSSSCSWPAAISGVVSVSAVDKLKNLAGYSNNGNTIDVAAPGGVTTPTDRTTGIYSTVGNDASFDGNILYTYGFYQGTSMAAPHVAGVAALMKSVMPGMTPMDFDAFLESGQLTEDLGAVGRDNDFGYGLIDAEQAVTVASAAIPAVPTIPARAIVTPTALNFAYSVTGINFTIRNEGNVTFANISSSVSYNNAVTDWLSVPAINGEGTYTATVNRSALSDSNVHAASIDISYDGGSISLPVLVAQSKLGITENAGIHYVTLLHLNPAGNANYTMQEEFRAVNGVYSFQFLDVEPGTYALFASTDNDNDYELCDGGEACGVYFDNNDSDEIVVTNGQASVTGLNFFTGYNSWLTGSLLNRPPISGNSYGFVPQQRYDVQNK